MSIIERINIIIINEAVSARAFDKSIGKKEGYISTLRKRKGTPGADVIAAIHKKYPKYNLIWLISGEGDWINENLHLSKPSTTYKKTSSITINIAEGEENIELFKVLEALIKKEIKK